MISSINSISQSPLKQQESARIVEIYIRIVSTKSIKIRLPSQVEVRKLKAIIQQKFKILVQDQILFLKGVKLNFDGCVLLQNKWIVHVIDKKQVDCQFVSFRLKAQSLSRVAMERSIQYTVQSNQLLSQFVQNNVLNQYAVQTSQVLIVESGRFLKPNETFKQQCIQTGTWLNLLHVYRDKSNSSNKYQNSSQISYSSIQASFSQIQPKLNLSISQIKSCQHDSSSHSMAFATERVSTIMTARNKLANHNTSIKCSKSSASNLTLNSPRINPQKKNIHVGHKQCNCHARKPRQAQIISLQYRKMRQKEIREMNLQKTNLRKQRKNQIQKQLIQIKNEKSQPSKDKLNHSKSSQTSSRLKKVKSLNSLEIKQKTDKKCYHYVNQNQEDEIVQKNKKQTKNGLKLREEGNFTQF